MKKILIAGSIAYDCLFTFPGVFKNGKVFNVQNKTLHFGGCAGNIVYNAKLLGRDFIMLGIAGKDFGEYKKWLKKCGIATNEVIERGDSFTSQAVIATDAHGDQLIFFDEGAAGKAQEHTKELARVIARHGRTLALALVSPNSKAFTMAVLDACRKNQVPYIFDPGQALPLFSKSELIQILKNAYGLMCNDYEWKMLQKRSGLSEKKIRSLCPLVVVTRGKKGSTIYYGGEVIQIAAFKPRTIKDPTGCGDAYRAGFLVGIQEHFPKLTRQILLRAGERASRLATACIESVGTQNHEL